MISLPILGLPGSGKGAQTKMIANKDKNIKIINVGDLIRQFMPTNSGELVDDLIIENLLKKQIKDINNQILIIDGAPRSLSQCQIMKKLKILDYIIVLNIDIEICRKRILGRRIHPESGRIYNTFFYPPKVANIDDITNQSLILRQDDNEQTFNTRVQIYNTNMVLINNFCLNNNIPIKLFNADQSPNILNDQIMEFINHEVKYSKSKQY